jgi:ferrous iron transport protein B
MNQRKNTSTLPAPSKLVELKPGQSAYVRTISTNGVMRRRLLDLGFVPGAEVQAMLRGRPAAPILYRVRGSNIALRPDDAGAIEIQSHPDPGGRPNCGDALGCRHCPSNGSGGMANGENGFRYIVALAGNPNTGKSTLFNALTGLRQHVGNWPGKTVTRAEGSWTHRGGRFNLIDLPGTYSLLSTSIEEEIARDFILFGAPDCTVVMVDGTCLERNLNLVLQILEITDRAVVCINLADEMRRKGILLDRKQLEADLGVPVILTSARSGMGLDRLKEVVHGLASREMATAPVRIPYPTELQRAIDDLVPHLERAFPDLPNPRWIALRLIDGGDARLRQEIEAGLLAHRSGRIGNLSLTGMSPTGRRA